MVKVITYGTYDLLHYGHIRLLERTKALGDYLIVGVTADDFDKTRGKINVQQPLMERIEAVKATGIADEVIVEEYEGQKIDDICRLGIDIFTVGSDWQGKFDYLKEYCSVIYLPRTEGISSSELRAEKLEVKIGFIGTGNILNKYYSECQFVNGIKVAGICSDDPDCLYMAEQHNVNHFLKYEELFEQVDAVYIYDSPRRQYSIVKAALNAGLHVLCEAPVAIHTDEISELFQIADLKHLILMGGIKTAYATAFNRLQLLVKSGKLGEVVSIDATCTSIRDISSAGEKELEDRWNSMFAWGPTALLPILKLLGTENLDYKIYSRFADKAKRYDQFSKIEITYPNAVATVKVGQGVKSEGDLIISGTKGYAYVPAPWWKTDYFEIRYESSENNKRYFYQLDGEGIRYEIVAFVRAVESGKSKAYVGREIVEKIVEIMEQFENGNVSILGTR